MTAVPNAIFFMGRPRFVSTKMQDRGDVQGSLVQKRHSVHSI